MNLVSIDTNQIWGALVTAGLIAGATAFAGLMLFRTKVEAWQAKIQERHEENKQQSAERHQENKERFERVEEGLAKILDPDEGKFSRRSEVKEAHRRMWAKFEEHDKDIADHDDRIRKVEQKP